MAKKLLLIESEEVFQVEAKKALNKLGYEIITASSYEEAVKLLESQEFQGIISDLLIREAEEELGKTGKILVENLKNVVSDPEIKKSFNSAYAPLGLHILGIAFAKEIPVMIISQSGLQNQDISFVRYAVIGKTGIFMENFLKMNVDKSSQAGWIGLMNKSFKNRTLNLLYVDLESRKEVFGV